MSTASPSKTGPALDALTDVLAEFAIENRCSHEDTPLADGELDETDCSIECRRHGSRFDLRAGRALNLPAYEPIECSRSRSSTMRSRSRSTDPAAEGSRS